MKHFKITIGIRDGNPLNLSKMKRRVWFRIKNVSEESIEEMYVESKGH